MDRSIKHRVAWTLISLLVASVHALEENVQVFIEEEHHEGKPFFFAKIHI